MMNPLVYIPALSALFGLALGWGLAAWLAPRAALWVTLALLAVAAGMVLMGRSAGGWDGLAYAILAILMFVPAALGCGLGGLGVWLRRRRRS
ncbi:MAG: hypothetical protein ACK4LQ_12195 [Pararhodobacter sp.]